MACLTMEVPVSPMRVMFLLRSLRSTCLTVPSSPADVKIAAQQEHRISARAGAPMLPQG